MLWQRQVHLAGSVLFAVFQARSGYSSVSIVLFCFGPLHLCQPPFVSSLRDAATSSPWSSVVTIIERSVFLPLQLQTTTTEASLTFDSNRSQSIFGIVWSLLISENGMSFLSIDVEREIRSKRCMSTQKSRKLKSPVPFLQEAQTFAGWWVGRKESKNSNWSDGKKLRSRCGKSVWADFLFAR